MREVFHEKGNPALHSRVIRYELMHSLRRWYLWRALQEIESRVLCSTNCLRAVGRGACRARSLEEVDGVRTENLARPIGQHHRDWRVCVCEIRSKEKG